MAVISSTLKFSDFDPCEERSRKGWKWGGKEVPGEGCWVGEGRWREGHARWGGGGGGGGEEMEEPLSAFSWQPWRQRWGRRGEQFFFHIEHAKYQKNEKYLDLINDLTLAMTRKGWWEAWSLGLGLLGPWLALATLLLQVPHQEQEFESCRCWTVAHLRRSWKAVAKTTNWRWGGPVDQVFVVIINIIIELWPNWKRRTSWPGLCCHHYHYHRIMIKLEKELTSWPGKLSTSIVQIIQTVMILIPMIIFKMFS